VVNVQEARKAPFVATRAAFTHTVRSLNDAPPDSWIPFNMGLLCMVATHAPPAVLPQRRTAVVLQLLGPDAATRQEVI
jgi:hypothetical protein